MEQRDGAVESTEQNLGGGREAAPLLPILIAPAASKTKAVSWSGANGGAGPARDLGSPARARAPELALSEQRSGRAASAFSPPRRRRAWGGGRGLRRPAKAVAAGAPRSLVGRCLLCSLPSPSLSARAGVVVGAACGPVPVAGCFFSPPQLAERGLSACFRIRWRSPLRRFFTR
ncbi:unnamed protein product [Urochloa humidicola]